MEGRKCLVSLKKSPLNFFPSLTLLVKTFFKIGNIIIKTKINTINRRAIPLSTTPVN